MAPSRESLALRNATVGHGKAVLTDASVSIAKGDRLALVGRNGSGKSTLLAALDGRLPLDAGERFVQPGTVVTSLPQEPIKPSDRETVLDYAVASGAEAYRAEAFIHALGLDPDALASELSGGQLRKASLARTLGLDPDVLLLDEPTNHLDLPTIEWLESELAAFNGAVIVISHDRAFLRRIATGILWIDKGELRRRDTAFDQFDEWVEDVERERANELTRIDKHLKAEERYRERGVTGRRKRNVRRLEKLATLKKVRAERGRKDGALSMSAETAASGGKLVVDLEGVTKRFGGKEVIRNFSTRIIRGDRVGIIGPNGAGKTTLVKMLVGELAPDEGNVKLGTDLKIGWFDQHRAILDPEATPFEIVGDGSDRITVGGENRHVMGVMTDFLFTEERARAKIATLSGGERSRVMLARVLTRPSNLLILDEPTNDLDMETLDMLEELLSDYAGTLIVVSHDRDFLDNIVTSTIAFEGDGIAREYVGGYSDVMAERARATDTLPKQQKQRERAAEKPEQTDAAAKQKPNKLSYKEQRDLDLLPGKIDELTAQISRLEAKLADPAFFNKDPEGFTKSASELDGLKADKDSAEERYLELEIKREELEAGGN